MGFDLEQLVALAAFHHRNSCKLVTSGTAILIQFFVSFSFGRAITPVISGSSLTISGTNAGSGSVYLLTSTNIASPLNTWLPVWTNVFTGDSSFTTNIPNAVDSTQGKQFFILGNTHN
jgi:hypothetical protein